MANTGPSAVNCPRMCDRAVTASLCSGVPCDGTALTMPVQYAVLCMASTQLVLQASNTLSHADTEEQALNYRSADDKSKRVGT